MRNIYVNCSPHRQLQCGQTRRRPPFQRNLTFLSWWVLHKRRSCSIQNPPNHIGVFGALWLLHYSCRIIYCIYMFGLHSSAVEGQFGCFSAKWVIKLLFLSSYNFTDFFVVVFLSPVRVVNTQLLLFTCHCNFKALSLSSVVIGPIY